jgi:hypothetical protein
MCEVTIPELKGVSFISGAKTEGKNAEDLSTLDLIEKIVENLDNTIVQCSLIEPTQNTSGGQSFDLPGSMRRSNSKNKMRKDSYSALILLNWAANVWRDSKDAKKVDNSFVPFLV